MPHVQCRPEGGPGGHTYWRAGCRFRLVCTTRLIPLSKKAIHYVWVTKEQDTQQASEEANISAFLSPHKLGSYAINH